MNEKVNNDDIKSLLYEISKSKIIPNFRNLKSEQISYKNNRDIVTIIDIEVEAFLKKHLSQSDLKRLPILILVKKKI